MTRTLRTPVAMAVAGVLAAASVLAPLAVASAAAVASSELMGAEGGGGGLEEIVVTATKQTEELQKVSAAITAIEGPALVHSGVTDIRTVQNLVPSVRFQQENASTEIYIRGVGSTLDLRQIEPPNALNFNGISIPREATSVPLYDVAQIEVLPGPQGTLYGRGNVGGTVNVNFRRPTHELETEALLEVGNYSLVHGSVAQNLPVTDTFALRIAADYLNHDGYQKSGADSQDDWGARLGLLYAPNDRLTAYLWASLVEKDGHPPNLMPRGVDPRTGALNPGKYMRPDPWNDSFGDPWAAFLPFGQPQAENQDYENHMVSGQLDYALTDAITLTYIPSYLDMSVSADYWLGALPGNKTDAFRQSTHELRVAGEHGWGRWLAGLYAYTLESHGVFTVAGFSLAEGGFPVSIVDRNRIRGDAAFGEATFDVADGLRIVAGGRYSHDARIGRGRYFNGTGLAPYDYDADFNHFDYKAGVEYDVAPGVMLYAVTQTGFQPGTFNSYASSPTLSNAVDAAELTAYTAGVKSRLLDDRLQINNEVFYYDYSDLIISAYNTLIQLTQTFNADKVRIYGDQLDVVYLPTDEDRLSVSVGYLHARNVRFDLPDGTASFDGYQLQYAPDWTVTAGYSHDFAIGPGYLRAAVSTRYESSYYADFMHTAGGKQDAYFKSDASVTWFANDGRWSVGAWVKNIENVAVMAATARGSQFPPLDDGATAFLETPRTFGLRATYSYR